MALVFLSYAEEDGSVAQEIAQCLEEGGHEAWYYQRDSLPGAGYLGQTRQAIERCDAFLLVVSKHSVESRQIHVEVVRAHECGKVIVPVLLGMSNAEFERLQPEWDHAAGSFPSIQIPAGGVAALAPSLLRGLDFRAVGKAGGAGTAAAPAVARARPEVQESTPVPKASADPLSAATYWLHVCMGLILILFSVFLTLGLFIPESGQPASPLVHLSFLAMLGIWPGLYLVSRALTRNREIGGWVAAVLWAMGGMFVIAGVSYDSSAPEEPPRTVAFILAALLMVAAGAISFSRVRTLLRLPRPRARN
jgi:hypothetical protein